MKRSPLAAMLLAYLAIGCGGPASPAPAAPSPTALAEPPPPSAAASAAPAATPDAPQPSAFTKVAEIGEDPVLYQLGKRVFIGRRHAATFLEVKGGKIERAHAVSPGLDTCKDDSELGFLQPGSLHGDFDKTAWLERLVYTARTTLITLDRWDGSVWRKVKGPSYSGQIGFMGAFPWRKSTLFLVTWYYHSSHFDVLDGPDKPPVPAPSTKPGGWPFTRMLAAAAVKTRDGDLWLGGADDDKPALERFSEQGGGSTFEVIPLRPGESGGEITHLAGTSSSDLYAAGQVDKSPFVARYDGKQWARIEPRFEAPVRAMAVAPDGSLWVVARAGSDWDKKPSVVWRLQRGAWSRVPASDPDGKPLSVNALWALEDGDVWLCAGNALYRSRPAESVFAWSDPLCPAIAMARPATERCRRSMFVLLYTLVKTTPKDYDFPLLRKAIKGHAEFAKMTFAETEERGRRYFVAFVDPDSNEPLAQGTKLVNLVKKEVQSSTPVLLCGEPRVVRKLDLDVIRGEVVKK